VHQCDASRPGQLVEVAVESIPVIDPLEELFPIEGSEMEEQVMDGVC
jgi:hypothetical protein